MFKLLPVAWLVAGALAFASCATKEKPPLIADPSSAGRESALPWNEQQEWENKGQFGAMADKMGDRR